MRQTESLAGYLSRRCSIAPFLLLLLITQLSGCQHTPSASAPATVTEAKADTAWTLRGRFSVRSPQVQQSAGIVWQQTGENFDITILGPAGGVQAQLRGTAQSVELLRNGMAREHSDDPERMVQEVLGVAIPLSSLQHWVRGHPSSSELLPSSRWPEVLRSTPPIQSVDLQRVDRMFVEAGWTVAVRNGRQRQQDDQAALPGRIDAWRRDTHLRLAIRRWQ